ncbi:MAG: Bax inhibitor-1/YccA family protein [Rhodothalassiaceae bacterium]
MNDRTSRPLTGARTGQGTAAAVDQGLRRYMLGIYNYMASGVLLTGITALLVYTVPALTGLLYQTTFDGQIAGYTPLGWIVAFAPLAFVLVLSFGINRLSASAAQALFWVYAGVMGLSLSSIFFVYTGQSIASTFFVTAAAFGALSLYGYTTKRNLTAMGSFLFMGLIGIIIAMLVNLFIQSSMMAFIINCLGVLIFAGLTAYDTQRIRQTYDYVAGDRVAMQKSSVMGALSLYLDFINLFLFLLRFMGNRE